MGFIVSPSLPFVIIITPTNVAIMAIHTGNDGTTRRNTIIMATNTGYRNMSVVASPDAI